MDWIFHILVVVPLPIFKFLRLTSIVLFYVSVVDGNCFYIVDANPWNNQFFIFMMVM